MKYKLNIKELKRRGWIVHVSMYSKSSYILILSKEGSPSTTLIQGFDSNEKVKDYIEKFFEALNTFGDSIG